MGFSLDNWCNIWRGCHPIGCNRWSSILGSLNIHRSNRCRFWASEGVLKCSFRWNWKNTWPRCVKLLSWMMKQWLRNKWPGGRGIGGQGKWILGYGTRFLWSSVTSTFNAPSNRREAVILDTARWDDSGSVMMWVRTLKGTRNSKI